jgi:hypothetical protein
MPEERSWYLKKMEEIYAPLGDKLPFIVEYRTGINFNDTVNAWDFAIDSVFRNKEDLRQYQESKEHNEAIKNASGIEKSKAIIDYEY